MISGQTKITDSLQDANTDTDSPRTLKRVAANQQIQDQYASTFYKFNQMQLPPQTDSFYDRQDFIFKNVVPEEQELLMLRKLIDDLKKTNTEMVSTHNSLNQDLLQTKAKHKIIERKCEIADKKCSNYVPEANEDTKLDVKEKHFIYGLKLDVVQKKVSDAKNDSDKSNIAKIIEQNIKHSEVNKNEIDYLIELKSRQFMIEHAKPITVIDVSQTVPKAPR